MTQTAILIDPDTRTITEVTLPDFSWQVCAKVCGCQYMESHRMRNKDGHYLLVDEEAARDGVKKGFFWPAAFPVPLLGKALVVRVDGRGETHPPAMRVAEVSVLWQLD